MDDRVKEVCSGLQQLLDDCAFHGASLDSCTCADFEKSGDCEHIASLHDFKGFYSTQYHHTNAHGVRINAYRVKWHVVSERMICVPETAPEKITQYKTSMTECQCPDFKHRGGSYIRDGRKVCKHIASLIDDAIPVAV